MAKMVMILGMKLLKNFPFNKRCKLTVCSTVQRRMGMVALEYEGIGACEDVGNWTVDEEHWSMHDGTWTLDYGIRNVG